MNRLIMIGIVLAALTIAVDHLIYELPQWLALILFAAAWILMIAGMIRTRMQK